MGRLIDADALIEYFNSMSDNCNLFRWRSAKKIKEGLAHIIRIQPTAYDVGKVVERLEKERICLEDNYGDEVICIGAHDAIDIVKRGGAE